ncbi:Glyoxalase/Bleomycin resistance protein/Dioxygenase superfamily protein [Nitrosomonas marina]|uniref:Glyoxalase/Bleomycin resistance protein/Dioxygenase superfamily protein n=1 Tax=Nitrosomonas marina TaxID=917 RepID=A0A1I0DZ36_9PROT|nr:VOC family protein [Nitrosomonas marina]SET37125.1 Glyoxalase/Bleomycin resistance protein/Dioxygenase superfamily protein [Nitrosomonas marina]
MFRIKHIDHVVLRVIDIKRMMRFYIDVLGCELEKTQENVGLYQLRAGSSLIDLVPVDSRLGKMGGAAPGMEGRNLDHFCLRIESFDGESILSHLCEKGYDGSRVESRYGAEGDGPSIYVKDPEGNTIELKGAPWETQDT